MHFYAEKLGEILCLILATFWLLLFFRTDLPEEKGHFSRYCKKSVIAPVIDLNCYFSIQAPVTMDISKESMTIIMILVSIFTA